jgi:hypothetical protein
MRRLRLLALLIVLVLCGWGGRSPPTLVDEVLGTSMRYDHVTFFVCRGRAAGFIVAQRGARTKRGVAIGGDAEKVHARYG